MKLSPLFKQIGLTLLSLMITAMIAFIAIIVYFETQLPNVEVLKDVHLQVPLRVYTADGKLIGVFGAERRNPIPLNEVPQQLINAILATEDQRFFEHPGVDPLGLLRATVELAKTGEKLQGGSTITMQVARNYFLNNQKTFGRKFREILLAIKIDSTFSKDKILELYLNKIYLGNHAYGIAAAAQVYYGKPLNELTLPQLAMIAGLPQAPSTVNPIVNPVASKVRRDHVLERMYEHGYIDKQTYDMAVNTPVATTYHGQPIQVQAPYVMQMITDALIAHYGKDVTNSGLNVYTTIDSKTQTAANRSLRDALLRYDARHGYRGPIANLGSVANAQTIKQWQTWLSQKSAINGLQPAAVTQITGQSFVAVTSDGQEVTVPWANMSWAQRILANGSYGAMPSQPSDVVKIGDVVYVIKMTNGTWRLVQIPQVEGGLVAINPSNGAILALVGGFDFNSSNFNRVTQAERQPGSSFKPFIYTAALEKGYTLASIVNDSPIVIWDPSLGGLWRPQNDDHKFNGPTRIRVALTHSMNLASIHLLQDIGINYAVSFASRFGFDPTQLPHSLSLALGTATLTPLQMAAGYTVFANGGYKVNPYVIERIVNTQGEVVYQAQPKTACMSCLSLNNNVNPLTPPNLQAPRIISAQTAYLMNSVLESVIRSGTGMGALALNRTDLAGKTGTSQNYMDGWFSGFNADIEATAWVGYDEPRSLGEYGATTALPMWVEFMGQVLKNAPENSMPEPEGIVTVKIDPTTGLLASDSQTDAIYEIFNKNFMPTVQAPANSGTGSTAGGSTVQIPQPLF